MTTARSKRGVQRGRTYQHQIGWDCVRAGRRRTHKVCESPSPQEGWPDDAVLVKDDNSGEYEADRVEPTASAVYKGTATEGVRTRCPLRVVLVREYKMGEPTVVTCTTRLGRVGRVLQWRDK